MMKYINLDLIRYFVKFKVGINDIPYYSKKVKNAKEYYDKLYFTENNK